ncbi:VCBS domain-containing protein [Verrucomicrobium sp. BvORR106]|uniref:VCBS domain-containing protein n=1 Tax=Verrucomicrobium sp. BvORR106 TaxID=1403819 RepID=UPI000570768D|nr:VCBS domain-containing protein [Verrucomicrobium sp. BvORR106]
MNFWPFKKKKKPAPAPAPTDSPAKLDEGGVQSPAASISPAEVAEPESTPSAASTPPPLPPASAPVVAEASGANAGPTVEPPATTTGEAAAPAPDAPAASGETPSVAETSAPAEEAKATDEPSLLPSRPAFKPPILAPEPPNYTPPPLPPVSVEPPKFTPPLAPDPPKPLVLENVIAPPPLLPENLASQPEKLPASEPAVEKEAPATSAADTPSRTAAPLPAFPAVEEPAAKAEGSAVPEAASQAPLLPAPEPETAPEPAATAQSEPEPEPVPNREPEPAFKEDTTVSPTFRTTGHVAGFILHGDGTWSFDATHVAYQHLNAGDPPVILSIPVLATHAMAAHGPTQHLVISVQGTVSGPMIGAVTQVFTYEGDRRVTGQLVPPDGAAAGGALQYATSVDVPGLILNHDGSYLLDPTDAAYQHLQSGERQVYAIPVTAFTADGQSDLRELVVGITGREDGAVAAGIAAHGIPHGGCVLHDRIQQGPGSPAHLSYRTSSLVPGFALRPDGVWSFDSAHPFYTDVHEGAVRIITVPVAAVDDHGNVHDTKAISITLHGTASLPLLSAMVMSGMEGGSSVQGSLGVHPDAAAGLFQFSYIGELPAGFHLGVDGTWSFHASPELYAHLDAGHTEVVVAQVHGEDGQGHIEGSMVAITVHGTAGAPSVGAVTISTHQALPEYDDSAADTGTPDAGTDSFGLLFDDTLPPGATQEPESYGDFLGETEPQSSESSDAATSSGEPSEGLLLDQPEPSAEEPQYDPAEVQQALQSLGYGHLVDPAPGASPSEETTPPPPRP